jgi:cellulose synthase/poly-beta-1,6-N-acetylglucosamine synthase-like glycosyltransferase/peptidoglycan/xylan/chitin deacetylase (PgdA/CDA1 family)/spore germination protein YaaH
MAPVPQKPFIFLDPGGRRWPRLRRLLLGVGILVFLGLVLFIQALFVKPQLALPTSVRKLKGQLKAMVEQYQTNLNPNADNWAKYANNLSLISSNQLVYQFKDNIAPGDWTVKVSNPEGQTSNEISFTVVGPAPRSSTSKAAPKTLATPGTFPNAPSISSISPTSFEAVKSDQKMTIDGANFTNGTTLIFASPNGDTIVSSAAKTNKISARRRAAQALHEVHLAYYVDWDPNSFTSLQTHAAQITHVAPEWLSVLDGDGTLQLTPDDQLEQFALEKGIALIPLLSNLGDQGWNPEAVEGLLLGPPQRRAAFIADLIEKLHSVKASGVLVDWEDLDPTYQPQMTQLLQQMSEALHAEKLELWLTVSTGEDMKPYDLDTLSDSVDHFVAQLFDENSDDDPAGPLASQDWFDGWLQTMSDYGDPKQWVITMGSYGYDWKKGAKLAETISFEDAMSRANNAGVDNVASKAPDYNPQYSYEDPSGEHTVCFLDAVTFLNELRSVRDAGMGGLGLYRLGSEDPQVWNVMEMPVEQATTASVAPLDNLQSSDTISNVGQGEIITVDDHEENGKRTVVLDDSGHFTTLYTDFPSFPVIYHEGAGDPHEVSLTFDDGPDPTWTPKILKILADNNLKATFFMVGQQAEQYPGLVKQVFDQGHIIGNHTYTHANIGAIPDEETKLEFNATQRLLESLIGRSTTLCRPPYNADSRPANLAELRPLKLVQDELGYLIVMENIDPEDWARPGTAEIVERVKEQRNEGNIILLHDAGGDREQTVEALPQIIDWLHTRGDRIVPLSELLHIPRDQLMPPVNAKGDSLTLAVSAIGFRVWRNVERFAWAFMITITFLVLLRTLMVAALATRNFWKLRRRISLPPSAVNQPLSVLIAAFNEEKVIAKTLHSVFETDYAGELEVIVVDDGSTDGTCEVVRALAAREPRLVLIEQPNGGKSRALSNGLNHASNELVVFLDADTQFEKQTLRCLAEPFQDERVGAVSGHARVGNLRTFIARCQSLEYICGFNLDRRAYVEWNCITVVPGAVSALRKSAVVAAGGFSEDTLAEDTDLTLTLHELGWRVEYAHHAAAWTEAPESVHTLAKQRFRWAFGTLQCLWKHRDLLFNPRFGALGWFSLPSIWFFQILLVALSPIIDGVLILSLTQHGGALWFYAIGFLVMDLILSITACLLDGEKLRRAWIILPMRFLYRPLLSWVIWRSILKALKGAWVGWGKIERTASVEARS